MAHLPFALDENLTDQYMESLRQGAYGMSRLY